LHHIHRLAWLSLVPRPVGLLQSYTELTRPSDVPIVDVEQLEAFANTHVVNEALYHAQPIIDTTLPLHDRAVPEDFEVQVRSQTCATMRVLIDAAVLGMVLIWCLSRDDRSRLDDLSGAEALRVIRAMNADKRIVLLAGPVQEVTFREREQRHMLSYEELAMLLPYKSEKTAREAASKARAKLETALKKHFEKHGRRNHDAGTTD
jgi:hypothetical protein